MFDALPSHPPLPPRRLIAALLAALLLGACGDPLPNSPNGPKEPESVTIRKTPNQRGHLDRLHGELVLFTEGSAYEQGFQHGYLLRDEIRSYYREYFETKLMPAFKLVPSFTYYWAAKLLERELTEEERAEIKGVAAGASLPEDQVLVMQANPPWASPVTWFGDRPLPRPAFGSAAFVARGPATVARDTILGYNVSGLDFGVRHRYALLRVHRPDKGYAFVTPGFVGQVLDAQGGWNEKGLAVSANAGLMRWENPSGVPTSTLTRRLVQHCRTVDEAEAMVRAVRRRAGQGMILTLATPREARVVEVAQTLSEAWQGRDHLVSRSVAPDGTLQAGNSYQSPELQALTKDAAAAMRTDRMQALLKASAGRLDVTRAMELLTDTVDRATGQQQPSDRTISVASAPVFFKLGPWPVIDLGRVTTFLSSVRDLDQGMLYLAQGHERIESPAQFVGFDVKQLLTGTASVPVVPVPSLPTATAGTLVSVPGYFAKTAFKAW
ncbi:MAG TPA: C45 family peptidase [Stenomitos sp.]